MRMLPIEPASEQASVRLEKVPPLATDMDDRIRTHGAYGRTRLARLRIIGAIALLGPLPIPRMPRLR
jgi:hypothetical protein